MSGGILLQSPELVSPSENSISENRRQTLLQQLCLPEIIADIVLLF